MLSRQSLSVLALNVTVAVVATAATWALVQVAYDKPGNGAPGVVAMAPSVGHAGSDASQSQHEIIATSSAGSTSRRARETATQSPADNSDRDGVSAVPPLSRFAFVAPQRLLATMAPRTAETAGETAAEAAMADAANSVTAGPVLRASVPVETGSLPSVASWSTEVAVTATPPPPVPQPRGQALPWLRTPKPTPDTVKRSKRAKRHTLASRIAEIGPGASERLIAKFAKAGVAWPPPEVVLIAIKDQKAVELFAPNGKGGWAEVHRYRVLAASGGAGPKLLRGDRQVPEGVYAISYLNPNSAFHVSLRVNYPNAFDREMAAKDGRKDLGGDIMIHGKNLSAGCLAVGDEAAEELFTLAAEIGRSKIKLIIAPTDFRHNEIPAAKPGQPEWLSGLYTEIATAMTPFKVEKPGFGLLSLFVK